MAMDAIERERKVIGLMVKMYCDSLHAKDKDLCAECRELLDYAYLRLQKCALRTDKPVCAKCSIHCYSVEKRGKIRQVMKFCGPRMALRHPVISARHLAASYRSKPR